MIVALIVGLIVGAIAKFVMPGRDPGGIFITMLLGLAGSMLAHFIGTSTGHLEANEPVGIFASILGAVVILLGYRAIAQRRIN